MRLQVFDSIHGIWSVWDNTETKCYGYLGMVSELLAAGVISYTNYSYDSWAFVKNCQYNIDTSATTFEEVLTEVRRSAIDDSYRFNDWTV